MKKKIKQNKHVKAGIKQTNKKKIRVSRQWHTHARIGLRTQSSLHAQARLCVASPCPEDLKTQKQSRNEKPNSNNQTRSE